MSLILYRSTKAVIDAKYTAHPETPHARTANHHRPDAAADLAVVSFLTFVLWEDLRSPRY